MPLERYSDDIARSEAYYKTSNLVLFLMSSTASSSFLSPIFWLLLGSATFTLTIFYVYQEHPSAVVSLLPSKVLNRVKNNVYPDKVLRTRAIPSSHKLQVTVFLTLPESQYNRDLGMFQVCISMSSYWL